jgi:hypothetical protein
VPDIYYNPDDFPGDNDITYPDNNVHNPELYGPLYCGMISFFASPLIWLQPSRIKDELMLEYSKIIDLFKKYRDDIVEGLVMPIGEVTEKNKESISLPWINNAKIKIIFSNSNIKAELKDAQLNIEFEDMRSFAFLSYEKVIYTDLQSNNK